MRYFLSSVIMLVCLVLGTAGVTAQTDFSVKIYAEDGSGWKDSVVIGKYIAATDAVTDSLSPFLVENELPPPAPAGPNQAADLRIVDPAGGGAYGQGTALDIRHLVSDYQSNTYRIQFRRSDPEGYQITLSWQAGLGSVSGGGFYLTDGFGGVIFPTVDMSQVTSFQHATWNSLSGGFVDIIVGDGRELRTFRRDSIALASDYKGKVGKYEKLKPYGSEWCFTYTNNTLDTVNGLYVKYSQAVTEHFAAGGATYTSPDKPGKEKKWNYSNILLAPGESITICGRGDKGKPMEVKKRQWYWKKDGILVQKELLPVAPDSMRLLLHMPNINNLGEELYVMGAAPLPNGIPVGLTDIVAYDIKGKPIYRGIIHIKKWKSVTKTLFKKQKTGNLFQDGPAFCLDTIKSKYVKKILKSLDPKKTIRYKESTVFGNKLIGELLTFKVNILMSQYERTPQGFGSLRYKNPGEPYDGMTMEEIALAADSAISCVGGLRDSMTYQDLADFLEMLNSTFSGPFDTLSFSGPGGAKTTGVLAVAQVPYLEADSPVLEPVPYADLSGLYSNRPESFALAQNYPNPFNPTTTIEFTIPDDAFVTLKVYNTLGQLVATLADHEEFTSGLNSVDFNAETFPSGVYFYHIVVDPGNGPARMFQKVMKMVLLK
jgi:hypothetical protein